MLILGLLGMYFVAAVVFVTSQTLLLRSALAILCKGFMFIEFWSFFPWAMDNFKISRVIQGPIFRHLRVWPWNLWMNTYSCKATFLACQIIFELYLSPLASAKYSKQTFTSAVLLDMNQEVNFVLKWQNKWYLLVGLRHKKMT